ncbi:hypothetical protein GPJ56_008515 [Histomonas meleagridis]|uniref:uncharacterized protein n=1 Tax=Histomonas meleagridis TaxID=135588 RepID=UPI00355A147D|nr:hypothetical protein GPJ56_008515 [Histomonas meleagridis]KAH0798345.1 hypothetical protein GO595_008894 [Histomonas meleagridis]
MMQITKARTSAQNTIARYVNGKRYDAAYQSLPTLCCSYENEKAYGYLISCIDAIKPNITEILSSKKKCPEEYVKYIAPICYAKSVLYIPELDDFVKQCISKTWPKEVEVLSHSNTIPSFLVHLVARNTLSHDEIHVFAHRFEQELKMNFQWLYEKYPLSESSTNEMKSVTILGKVVSNKINTAAPLPSQITAPPKSTHKPSSQSAKATKKMTELPELPMINTDSYLRMMEFVKQKVKNWDTWQFEKLNVS